MRVCCMTTVLAALALRACAEPAPRRLAGEWHALARPRALHELFEPEPAPPAAAPAPPRAPPPLPPGALHKERRRSRSWSKRTPRLPSEIANQMMLRASRSSRAYDVPQIECPPAADGMERFACPTPDRQGRYRCIDDHVLCDGFIDCPNGEDEDRQACMFYKTTKAHLDVLADALLRWARGR
ncbi:low-density lipoprotein receptor domain-containing jelly belly protein [Choristoneura fumiferana]|uniref:low-density lipoprotein receptor domain-containing jelly belly protein n=1 Tax=Choristoneura fumiferana TaxID=7141 RepID=UPI003D15ADE7